MGHGAILASDELQDHVFPARVDARDSAVTAEPRDLQDPPVHIFQKCEIVAAAACICQRLIFPEVFGFRCLNKLYDIIDLGEQIYLFGNTLIDIINSY